MSNKSWQNEIQAALQRQRQPPKLAIIGIGHELRGDDAAGLVAVHALEPHKHLLVIEAGTDPENHTHKLRRFEPDLVLLIDAAQMNLAPGEIRLLNFDSLDGLSASTHTTPLALVAQYIAEEFGCEVLLLGIQPTSTDFGAPLSPAACSAVESISRALRRIYDGR